MRLLHVLSDPLSPLALADHPLIQNRLDVTEAQATQVDEIRKKFRSELEKALLEKRREFEQKLFETLLPKQGERLRQIVIQSKGRRSLQEPYVAEALKLSGKQREQIQALFDKAQAAEEKLFASLSSGELQLSGEQLAKLGKADRERLEREVSETLTVEQRQQYAQMQGEKLDFDVEDLFASEGGLDDFLTPLEPAPTPDAQGGDEIPPQMP